MRPRIISKTLTALDRDGISVAQTPLGAGNLTITGILASGGVATIPTGQQTVGVYSGANIAARVFTLYGTDDNGNSISETITGVNAGTTSSLLNYKTVTRVAVDAGTGADVEVGIVATGASPPIIYDQYISPFNIGMSFEVSGTVNGTVQLTFDDVFAANALTTTTGLIWYPHTVLASIAVNTNSNVAYPIAAARLLINSGDGTATFVSRQAGIVGG